MKTFLVLVVLLLPLTAVAGEVALTSPSGWVWPEADGFDSAQTIPLSDDGHAFGPQFDQGVGIADADPDPAQCLHPIVRP